MQAKLNAGMGMIPFPWVHPACHCPLFNDVSRK